MSGEASQQSPAQGGEAGQKSKFLSNADGGVLDSSPSYEPVTDGTPEKGVFHLVGGYLDEGGALHQEVELRAMSGNEEDLLSGTGPMFARLNAIMSTCVKRIGTISDGPGIQKAVAALPNGTRQHLLISLRRVTHWRKTKDIYDMKVRCPECGHQQHASLDLGDLELFEMPDPKKRQYILDLPDERCSAVWDITTGKQDRILAALSESGQTQTEMLTWGIVVRLKSLGDMTFDVQPHEMVDPSSGSLLKHIEPRIGLLRAAVKKLSSADRDLLREDFMANEPGVDTDLDFKCTNVPKCGVEFVSRLDVAQRSFFFPSATSKRSKRRSFT